MSKIVLTAARDIALDKLVASEANVRRIKAGLSVEELAEDIARRGLLQSLNVRPVLSEDGNETGTFAVTAGGRRLAALKLLVKQKRLARNAPVPCIVKVDGIAQEDSLAENVMREALHPLDQFRAFETLLAQGTAIDEIAARFFVTPQVVRQRLKLAAVSPKLLDLYVAEEMSLEQLTAFCVTDDHVRQEQIWEALTHAYNKEPHTIRRMLTEGAVKSSDRRAVFVGVEAYEAAGGIVLRDLFSSDNGGWLQDAALLDRLARDKLGGEAEKLRADGWKWTEVAIDFPYGHAQGLRRLPAIYALSEEEQARHDGVLAEYAAISDEHEGAEEIPEEVDARLAELEQQIAAIDERPASYDPADIARAGVFVSLDYSGALKIERGFVRPEDEAPRTTEDAAGADSSKSDVRKDDAASRDGQSPTRAAGATDEDEVEIASKLSDRLTAELTAHRTMALREALANDPDAAFLAVTHALALNVFYGFGASDTCLEIEARSIALGPHASGLGETVAAQRNDRRHTEWEQRLPHKSQELWDHLIGLDHDDRAALFAYCAALGVNAVDLPHMRRPGALAHADRLASHVSLDMADQWTATVESYFGKVTKAQILASVREAKGETAVRMIDDLKKSDMAAEAERLCQGTRWLPEILRTKGLDASALPPEQPAGCEKAERETDDLPAFLAGGDPGAPYPAAAE